MMQIAGASISHHRLSTVSLLPHILVPCCYSNGTQERQDQTQYVLSAYVFSVLFVISVMVTYCVPLVCVCMCSVSWLFWLCCVVSSLDKRLARKTPLMKPVREKPMPKSAYEFFGLVYCFIVLLHVCFARQPGLFLRKC